MESLSYLLSLTGLAAIIASLLIKGKNMKLILFFLTVGNTLMGLSYLCVSNENGALTCFIATVQSIINFFFSRKNKAVPVWLMAIYAISFVTVNLMVFSAWFDLLAIAASLMSVMLVSAVSGKLFRRWALANNLTWCVYDIISGSYGTLISHLVLSGFTAVGMIMHDLKRTKTAK